MVESYPLCWPEGWKRTTSSSRTRNWTFWRGTLGRHRDSLIDEVRKLGGKKLIISTNMPTRLDGMLYANAREPEDGGVAAYFDWKGKPMCFSCDQFQTVRENMRAIALTIYSIRAIERYGASDMMERAFRGFTQIAEHPWKVTLGYQPGEAVSRDSIDAHFRDGAKVHHPDRGGDENKFKELVRAREAAVASLGLSA